MPSTAAENEVEVLRQLFGQHGLQRTVASNNGPLFHSDVFEEFLEQNAIKRKFSTPFYPATNRAAERAVQVLKQGLRKPTGETLHTRLSPVRMAYRVTPHIFTGFAPSELLFKRRLRTTLNRLYPKKMLTEFQFPQQRQRRKFEE